MTIIDTTPGLNAADLATVSAMPLTEYSRGWEDAYYQAVYYNPYVRDMKLWHEYKGHKAGTEERCLTANAG